MAPVCAAGAVVQAAAVASTAAKAMSRRNSRGRCRHRSILTKVRPFGEHNRTEPYVLPLRYLRTGRSVMARAPLALMLAVVLLVGITAAPGWYPSPAAQPEPETAEVANGPLAEPQD
jgi:hypothetical protein